MLISSLAAALLAAVQTTPAPPCNGRFATVRVSEIKPGQRAVFEKAVADHSAWYAARNSPVRTYLAPVLAQGRAAFDPNVAMTITVYGRTPAQPPQQDAAYSAFVAAYRASSTMRSETRVCLPDLAG